MGNNENICAEGRGDTNVVCKLEYSRYYDEGLFILFMCVVVVAVVVVAVDVFIKGSAILLHVHQFSLLNVCVSSIPGRCGASHVTR